ncbi:MAG: ABC transporter substrate-binding protein, partial [Tissierellia bacterium]|nr:ABC transporter substrate-binding protein [Tissierellia bacterium]
GTPEASEAPEASETPEEEVVEEPVTEEPAEESGEEGYKEEIIIAMADEFTTIDAMETTAESNQIVQDCTHDLLTDTNLDEMVNAGELVESWEMITPDNWKFQLKDNVTFHNMEILTVDDVEFTFERAKTKATTSAYMEKIKEFKKIDDLNFEVFLEQGDVDFNYVFAANSLAILSKKAFDDLPEEEAVKIGTGPWKFEKFVAGDYVSLVRFEESTLYPVPNTKRLVFRMIPEASTRMIALENGEVDVIMTPSAVDYSKLVDDEDLELLSETGRGQHYVAFNLSNTDSIVSDVKFREAIAKAVDKEEMILAAWDGYGVPSTSIMCRDMEYYADIDGISHDPEAAKELLKDFSPDELKLNLITSDAAHRVKMAENFQAQMVNYGLTIDIEFMQQAALVDRLENDSSVELFILSWTPGMNADYMYRNPLYSTGGRNYANFNEPEMDELIDAAAGETDSAKRAEMYRQIQEDITTKYIPWVPIAQADLTMGIAKGIEGIKIHPALVHQFKMIEKKAE